MGIEIAVRAFADTPGNVDIERQWQRDDVYIVMLHKPFKLNAQTGIIVIEAALRSNRSMDVSQESLTENM